MKLHLVQPNDMQCSKKTFRDEKVPLGTPPAWEIDRWKREKPQVDRPQPRLEIEEMPPPEWHPEEKKKDDVERGVVILEF